MIDIENKIVDTLDNALTGVYVTTSYRIVEKEFPALQVHYTYTGDLTKTFDNNLNPHHAKIMVQTDAYSLDRDEAKAMNALVVDTMHGMKFTCTESRELSGFYSDLFRITSRFTAIVGEGVTTSETTTVDGQQVTTTTTTHQMYRR